MVINCKLCIRENSIDIIKESITPYNEEDDGKFKTVVVFDCRGMEPVDFSPRAGFAAESKDTGTKFTEIAFNEGDNNWFDYDEKSKKQVVISELQHKFVTVEHVS